MLFQQLVTVQKRIMMPMNLEFQCLKEMVGICSHVGLF
jgi:hypothetical protein